MSNSGENYNVFYICFCLENVNKKLVAIPHQQHLTFFTKKLIAIPTTPNIVVISHP
jgi:hypothetical protein